MTKKGNRYEKITYIVLVVVLIVYGMAGDSEVARSLLQALKDAFSIILIG